MLTSDYYDIIYPLVVESPEKDVSTPKKEVPKYVEKLEEKNGQLWDCVSSKRDVHGGKIYTFRAKREYDILQDHSKCSAYQQKSKDIFPAIESISKAFLFLQADQDMLRSYRKNCRKVDQSETNQSEANHEYIFLKIVFVSRNALKKLGYDYQRHENGNLLSLPDRTALLARWSLLRETLPYIPPLDIVSSEGIASDMAFVDAFISHDGLLSTGKEFVHDHLAHLIPTLSLMLLRTINGEKFTYAEDKAHIVQIVRQSYDKLMTAKDRLSKEIPWLDREVQKRAIKHLPQIETVLGILADGLSGEARPDYLRPSQIAEDTFEWLLGEYVHTGNWLEYMHRRYGPENVLSPDEMKELWALITSISK